MEKSKMCGKMGENEVDSMKNIMTMCVYFVIADVLEVDIMDLEATTNLDKDLHCTVEMKRQLSTTMKDMFNGFSLEFEPDMSVKEVINQVMVNNENRVLH